MNLKSILSILAISILLFNCNKNDDDGNQNNNPNIPDFYFNTGNSINYSLGGPQRDLEFVNNPVVFSNFGINGIVVINNGNGNFSAFELSDPNHVITTCSSLTINDIIVSCSCEDGNSYNILSGGLPEAGTTGQYTLVRYKVEVIGSVIRVYNN